MINLMKPIYYKGTIYEPTGVLSFLKGKPMICGSWVANRPTLSTFSGIQQQKPQLRMLQFNKHLMYMLYYIVLYSTILYHIILYYIILLYIVLLYISFYIIHFILYIMYIKHYILEIIYYVYIYILYYILNVYVHIHIRIGYASHRIIGSKHPGFGWANRRVSPMVSPLEDFLKIESMVSWNYYEL